MIVIRKKRILFILSCCIISVFSFFIFDKANYKNDLTLETVSFPVSNKVIVIDAGHGTPDEGNYLLTLINNS